MPDHDARTGPAVSPDTVSPDTVSPDTVSPDTVSPYLSGAGFLGAGEDDVIATGVRWRGSGSSPRAPRDGWSRWRGRWRASTVPVRILAVAAIGFPVAALGVGGLALLTHPRHYQRTVTQAAVPGRITVDSSGCPVGVRCAVDARVEPDVADAVLRAFPGAHIISSVVVRAAASGQMYRRVVVAQSTRTTVIVSTQCIPGTRAGPRRILRGVPGPMVVGSLVTYAHRLEIVVPGRDGCSASIEADVTGVQAPNDAPVFALADDPAVRSTS